MRHAPAIGDYITREEVTALSAKSDLRAAATVLFQAAHGSKMRSILTATVLLCIWWNVGLMAQFGSGMMDRQRLELSKNTYNTFVVVPLSLPNLVYRYLFQRQSFYESAAE